MDTTTTKKNKDAKKILVVEDEPAMLNALYDKLTLQGFIVFKAKNGTEGLDLASKEVPDLIILDVIMPTMDGITMMKELRTLPGLDSTPVIFLSNLNPNDEMLYQVNRLPPSYYLIKSETKLELLVNKVKQILNL